MKPASSLLLSTVLGTALCACAGSADASEVFLPPTVRAEDDLAISCLVWGEVSPPLAELPEERLDEVVGVLSHLLAAYGHADFDAFLALREPDLEHGKRVQADHVHELHTLARQLGVTSSDLPATWLATLRVFWETYYEEPPVRRWIPDETVLHLSSSASEPMRERSFEALRSTLEGARIDHRLVVPVDLHTAEGSLPSLDLVLGFETGQGGRGRLLAQFVARRGAGRGWSLVRAVTAMEARSPHDSPVRQLIL